MSDYMPAILAAISGICFGMMGVLLKAGHQRSLPPLLLMFIPFVLGTFIFGVAACGSMHNMPSLSVWVCGLGAGCSQYLSITVMRSALKLGPLSPFWCATNLSYVLPLPVAWLVLGERVTMIQLIGCITGVVGVIIGAVGQLETTAQKSAESIPRVGKYLMVLGALFLMNSMPNIAVKLLNTWPAEASVKYMSQYRWFFLFLLYGGAAVMALIDLLFHRMLRTVFKKNTLIFGGIIATSSMAGLGLLTVAGRLPAAIVFPVNSAANMVSAALISVVAFKERISWALILMIICVLASAIMVNL